LTKGTLRVPIAEFEEKTYETAMAIELAESGGFVHSPGQVAENILGFDSAASPAAANPLWRVLSVPCPAGLRLVPPLWSGIRPSAAQLPGVPISVILQYKRPQYIVGPRAHQWKMWGQPYYRFPCTPRQHGVLTGLERKLGPSALVRYAAPAFWQFKSLELASLQRRVTAQSGYVSPLALGKHRVWTYLGPGVSGRPNPSGRPIYFEGLDDLRQQGFRLQVSDQASDLPVASRGSPLLDHLHLVGEVARSRRPWLAEMVRVWRANLQRADLGLPNVTIEGLCDLASIVTLTQSIGASWGLFTKG
jgi:hypothetical protein